MVSDAVTKERTTSRYFLHRCRLEGAAKALLSDVAGGVSALASELTYTAVTPPKGYMYGLSIAFGVISWARDAPLRASSDSR